MSRAYRIKISECLRTTIRGDDNVCSQLEILNLLPSREMSELLRQELEQRGFQQENDQMVREQNGIRLVIDPSNGKVLVEASGCEDLELQKEEEGYALNLNKEREAKKVLKEKAKRNLEMEAQEKQAELQREVTDRLERELTDLRRELDQIASAVTAKALKRKAAQMGKIKEVSEDSETGSMTIVLEV